MNAYTQYLNEQEKKAQARQEWYETVRRNQADATAQHLHVIYQDAADTAYKQYAQAEKRTAEQYDALYDAAIVNELVARRETEEAIRKLGFSHDMVNTTQQTAFSLSRMRAHQQTSAQKQTVLDRISQERDATRGLYEREAVIKTAEIYDWANRDIQDNLATLMQKATDNAIILHIADKKKGLREAAARAKETTKQTRLLEQLADSESTKTIAVSREKPSVNAVKATAKGRKLKYGADKAKEYLSECYGAQYINASQYEAIRQELNISNQEAFLDTLHTEEQHDAVMRKTYGSYTNYVIDALAQAYDGGKGWLDAWDTKMLLSRKGITAEALSKAYPQEHASSSVKYLYKLATGMYDDTDMPTVLTEQEVRAWFIKTEKVERLLTEYLNGSGYKKPNEAYRPIVDDLLSQKDDVEQFFRQHQERINNIEEVLLIVNESANILRQLTYALDTSNATFSKYANEKDYAEALLTGAGNGIASAQEAYETLVITEKAYHTVLQDIKTAYGEEGKWVNTDMSDTFLKKLEYVEQAYDSLATYYEKSAGNMRIAFLLYQQYEKVKRQRNILQSTKRMQDQFSSEEEYHQAKKCANMTIEQLQEAVKETETMQEEAEEIRHLQDLRDHVANSEMDDVTVDRMVAQYDQQIESILRKYGFTLSGDFYNTEEVLGYVADMHARAKADYREYVGMLDAKQAAKYNAFSLEKLKAKIDELEDMNATLQEMQSLKSELQHKITSSPDRIKGKAKDNHKQLVAQYRETCEAIDKLEAEMSPIAYSTADGKNITWQMLYDEKKRREDFNEYYDLLSSQEDWEDYADLSQKDSDSSFEGWIADEEVLTQREEQVYAYLQARFGEEAADVWKKDAVDLSQRKAALSLKVIQKWVSDNTWAENALLAAPASVISNLLAPVEYGVDLTKVPFTGEMDRNYQSDVANTIRANVNNKYDWMIGDKDVHDMAFSTGMSVAESFIAMETAGPFGIIPLALSAAAAASNDAIDRGMSTGQVIGNGLLAGVFEAIFEYLPFENFQALKKSTSSNTGSVVKGIFQAVGINIGEEVATAFANTAYDILANGDFSQYEAMIRFNEQLGMSSSEAKVCAAAEIAEQVFQAGEIGGIMGLVFGASGTAIGRHKAANLGETLIADGQVKGVIALGKEMDEGTRAYELAWKLDGKANALQLGELYMEIHNELSGMDREEAICRGVLAIEDLLKAGISIQQNDSGVEVIRRAFASLEASEQQTTDISPYRPEERNTRHVPETVTKYTDAYALSGPFSEQTDLSAVDSKEAREFRTAVYDLLDNHEAMSIDLATLFELYKTKTSRKLARKMSIPLEFSPELIRCLEKDLTNSKYVSRTPLDTLDVKAYTELIEITRRTGYGFEISDYPILFGAIIDTSVKTGWLRAKHRRDANKQFFEALLRNEELRRYFNKLAGMDILSYMRRPRGRLRNPPGNLEWHHPYDDAMHLQLLRKADHRDKALQDKMHLDGRGGMAIYHSSTSDEEEKRSL